MLPSAVARRRHRACVDGSRSCLVSRSLGVLSALSSLCVLLSPLVCCTSASRYACARRCSRVHSR